MARRSAKSVEERFWEKVEKGPGCWKWVAALRNTNPTAGHRGYGTFTLQSGKAILAHRLAYILTHGGVALPPGIEVCHTCDNTICVNPAHLFLGTTLDNQRDRRAKGHHGDTGHRLTPEQRDELAARYLRGEATQTALAREYGVTRRAVRSLVLTRQRTELRTAA